MAPRSARGRSGRRLALWLTVAVLAVLAAVPPLLAALPGIGWTPPAFERVRAEWRPSDAWLLDRHGEPLHALRMDFRQRRAAWVPLEAVSPALVRAVIAAEDRRFHRHGGVDLLALAAAARQTLTNSARRGASTLAMQVAGLIDPALEAGPAGRGPGRKLRQILAGWRLQNQWGRERVLEAYLNLAPSRGELRGVGALALGLFAKRAAALDRQESALIAALLPAPSAPAPRVLARTCRLLGMQAAEPGCTALAGRFSAALAAPMARWPAPADALHLARRALHTPGQRVSTTLDARVQRLAHRALRDRLAALAGRNARDGAALVVDNGTGEVLAWVGSAGPASRAPRVDGVLARRQAGSTLKPFLYGLALERRLLTAASLLEDTPLALDTGVGIYAPNNYDRDFRGLVSVRTALAASLNVPAVRTLDLLGVAAFHDRLRALGYDTLEREPDHYGWSLALGSAAVSLLEQVGAYRSLATGGLGGALRWQGPAAAAPAAPARRVLPAGVAWLVADILADPAARSRGFGLGSVLAPRFWAAVKTGTSKDMRDNWCLGFSERYTVGVWTGNFEGDAMHGVSGLSGAAPAWLDIMTALHAAEASVAPPPPAGLRRQWVRYAGDIEPARREWFLSGTGSGVVRPPDPAHREPRIVSPPDGLILALDPDIPPTRERVPLSAHPERPGLRWRLDGVLLERGVRAWRPRPGRHVLQLEDAAGRVLDSVGLQVRGAPRTADEQAVSAAPALRVAQPAR